MKHALVTVLALVGGAVAAPVASAAQPLTVTWLHPYFGFETEAPPGWEVTNCHGGVGYDSNGVKLTDATPDWLFYSSVAPGHVMWRFDNAGPPGVSVVRVTGTCDLRRAETQNSPEWQWRTQTRRGTNTLYRSRSSRCRFDALGGDLQLECLGGKVALARYRFSLPADARGISRSIRGSIGCCSPGTVSRTWSGNRATIRVTNRRSYSVRRVSVSYWTQVNVARTVWIYDIGTV